MHFLGQYDTVSIFLALNDSNKHCRCHFHMITKFDTWHITYNSLIEIDVDTIFDKVF